MSDGVGGVGVGNDGDIVESAVVVELVIESGGSDKELDFLNERGVVVVFVLVVLVDAPSGLTIEVNPDE